MSSGAPDYQRVFTLVAPSMTHGAPDWQETAVGPSGAPIAGGITPLGTAACPGGLALVALGEVVAASVVLTNTAAGYAVVSFTVGVQFSTAAVFGAGIAFYLTGDYTPYSEGAAQDGYQPGDAVNDADYTGNWTGLVMLTKAAAALTIEVGASASVTGTVLGSNFSAISAWQ